MLEQNAVKPLYEQLMDAIKQDIEAQKYREGDRLPTETEMEAIYHVSRITVRRAIKELCDRHILVKKQGKGTFILDKSYPTELIGIAGFHEVVSEQKREAGQELLSVTEHEAGEWLSGLLRISPVQKVAEVRRLFRADGRPMLIDTCYLPLLRFPQITRYFSGDFSVYSVLRERYGVRLVNAEKVIRTRKAHAEEAHLLGCRPGDPVFDTQKTVYDENGVPIHTSVGILNGETTSYIITLDNQSQMKIAGPKDNVPHLLMQP